MILNENTSLGITIFCYSLLLWPHLLFRALSYWKVLMIMYLLTALGQLSVRCVQTDHSNWKWNLFTWRILRWWGDWVSATVDAVDAVVGETLDCCTKQIDYLPEFLRCDSHSLNFIGMLTKLHWQMQHRRSYIVSPWLRRLLCGT